MINRQSHAFKRLPFIKRFHLSFRVTPGCWLWEASGRGKGYGSIYYNNKVEQAHRVSYIVHCGPIPDGMRVLHKCDTPACVNPDHLFLGTQNDNVQDAKVKGRMRGLKGDRSPKAKLKPSDIVFIKQALVEGGITQAQLAAKFGVSQPVISAVKLGKMWTHVVTDHENPPWARNYKTKLSDEEVSVIRGAILSGELTQRQLAEMFGVTQPTISAIKTGNIWRRSDQSEVK